MMLKSGFNKKGIVLFIVLGTLLVVISLTTVILSIIVSQARLTHHQTSRIQAYYAAMAGINLAMENLRTKAWGPGNYTLTFAAGDFKPASLVDNEVSITITGSTGGSCPCTISVTANYTYTP